MAVFLIISFKISRMLSKKYKSDNIVRPLVVILFLLVIIANQFYHGTIWPVVCAASLATLMLGVEIYRNYIEGNKNKTIYYTVALLAVYIILFFFNNFTKQ